LLANPNIIAVLQNKTQFISVAYVGQFQNGRCATEQSTHFCWQIPKDFAARQNRQNKTHISSVALVGKFQKYPNSAEPNHSSSHFCWEVPKFSAARQKKAQFISATFVGKFQKFRCANKTQGEFQNFRCPAKHSSFQSHLLVNSKVFAARQNKTQLVSVTFGGKFQNFRCAVEQELFISVTFVNKFQIFSRRRRPKRNSFQLVLLANSQNFRSAAEQITAHFTRFCEQIPKEFAARQSKMQFLAVAFVGCQNFPAR
jgi:hypothetical protein